jgi:hypothetical protein
LAVAPIWCLAASSVAVAREDGYVGPGSGEFGGDGKAEAFAAPGD